MEYNTFALFGFAFISKHSLVSILFQLVPPFVVLYIPSFPANNTISGLVELMYISAGFIM